MIPGLYYSSHNHLARIKSNLALFIAPSMWVCLQLSYAVTSLVVGINLQRWSFKMLKHDSSLGAPDFAAVAVGATSLTAN